MAIFKKRPRLKEEVGQQIQSMILNSVSEFYEYNVVTRAEIIGQNNEEKDRIINELFVHALAFVYLMLDSMSRSMEDEAMSYFRALRDDVLNMYLQGLKDLGVEKKYTERWRDFLELRISEYERGRNENRDLLPEVDEGNPWLVIVSIGCYAYIRKTENEIKNDSLSIEILKWFSSVAAKTHKIVEEQIM